MAYCKDCIYLEICEAFGRTVTFPVDDGVCLHFAKADRKDRDCHWATEQAYKNGYEKGYADGERKCNERTR